MELLLNGKAVETHCCRLRELVPPQEGQIVIYNGYQTEENPLLQPHDNIVYLSKGQMPDREGLEAMLTARHTPQIHQRLQAGAVAIAGMGGLGSHIAVMLTRMGVGRLLLVDDDVVEPTNLNRQHYTLRHLGMPKVEAMAQQLQEINPFVQIVTKQIKVTEDNAASVFDGWDLVCEAFDRPEAKAMLINTLLPDQRKVLVAASGMAGYDSANQIHTVRKLRRLYLCGDEISQSMPGHGLMAPRVQICAGHQANMVVRLLLGLQEP